MKPSLLLILTGLFTLNLFGQVSFSNVDIKLKVVKNNNTTQLICSNLTTSIKFVLKRKVTVMQQNNIATIDSQTIQLTPLKFSGYKVSNLTMDDQKQLLDTYVKYELDYFKNELNVEVINPNNQWVVTNSKGWFVWYFRVGNMPTQINKPTEIQLFASTVVGDKILTINAPIPTDSDFAKAGLIVNEMMETFRSQPGLLQGTRRVNG